ncbi:MAG TPA: hypothetical protein VN328_12530, partial [Thermodesulfovibrionales bacterium]|nr:hypothetical protein [Thermodesulfovibrionales bacterium]
YGTGQFTNMRYKLCTDCHPDPHRGQFKDKECTPCHTIKTWREKDLKFDHNKDTKYKLEGKHADPKCVECHPPGEKDASAAIKRTLSLPKKPEVKKDVRYANAQFRDMRYKLCTDCHEDPHKGQFKDTECTPCHTLKSWREKDLKFDHNKDSKYKLEAKHADAKCVDCHIPGEKDASAAIKKILSLPKKQEAKKDVKYANAQFREMRYKLCTDCHEDIHKGQFKDKLCTPCHTIKSWRAKDIVFDHTKDSKFKLEGKHADLKCWECHPPDEKDANAYILRLSKLHRKPEQMDKERETKKDVKYGTAQFKEIRYKLCKDCHDDVHKKRLGETCEYCHTNKNWKKKQ